MSSCTKRWPKRPRASGNDSGRSGARAGTAAHSPEVTRWVVLVQPGSDSPKASLIPRWLGSLVSSVVTVLGAMERETARRRNPCRRGDSPIQPGGRADQPCRARPHRVGRRAKRWAIDRPLAERYRTGVATTAGIRPSMTYERHRKECPSLRCLSYVRSWRPQAVGPTAAGCGWGFRCPPDPRTVRAAARPRR